MEDTTLSKTGIADHTSFSVLTLVCWALPHRGHLPLDAPRLSRPVHGFESDWYKRAAGQQSSSEADLGGHRLAMFVAEVAVSLHCQGSAVTVA